MVLSIPSRLRRRLAAAVAAAGCATAGVALAPAAQADVLASPARTWGVGPATTTSASGGTPRVLAILPVGDRVFVAGTFTSVLDPAGRSYPAKNLAVFSASTGAADLSFQGGTNATVTSLATDGAGTLYLGGTFGTVNGQTRRGLAALDAGTGALRSWAPSVSAGQVDAVAFGAGSVYAGGNFSGVTGGGATSKAYLAKTDAVTGSVDASWAPAPNDRVRALAVANDGSGRLLVGGDFTSVSVKSSTNKLAAVTLGGSGSVDTAFRAGGTNGSSAAPVFDVTSDASRVYVAAAGSGGACTALSLVSGAQVWSDHSNGNMQSVRLSGGKLYCGGHFSGSGSFMGATRQKIAAVDAATGALSSFAPTINSSQGVWALASDATHVYVGGDFSKAGGVAQPHFAMFLDSSVAGAPRPPAGPAARADNGVVHLTWSPPSSDGGYALQKYKLYRATTPGGEDLTKAPLVTLSNATLAYDDTAVTNGATYYYVLVATNAAGTSGPSAEVSATPRSSVTATPPGAPTGLTASSPSGGVHLSWSAPASDGGAPISGYTVYRGTAAGAEDMASPVGTSTTTSFDDTTSLTTGTTYYYVVTATNTAGEGPRSNEASATVTAGVPGEPTLTAQVQSGAKVLLSWTVPPDGGSPITKYVVVRNSVRLVTLSASPTGPTSYTDATPPSGAVTYQVKAVNAIGSGPLSSKVTVTVP